MRALRVLLVLLLMVVGTAAAPAAAAVTPTPVLVGVRAAHHPGFDRIVFEFTGGLPSSRRASWVTQVVADPSGLPVPVAGRAVLALRFEHAAAHDDAGRVRTPVRTAWALPNVMTTVRTGDFEAVLSYAVGLTSRQSVRVSTLTRPDRVVVDVGVPFRTVQRPVWFFDQARYLANREPFFRPVLRPLLPGLPATTAMHRLYAGVTPTEHAQGLRHLASGSTGFADLRVVDRVARLRLTGGCSSGGSTVTVAGEIVPTLRQFPSVDWVKVFSPAGQTARASGRSDSIPACLEP